MKLKVKSHPSPIIIALSRLRSAERSEAETEATIAHERSGEGEEFVNIVRLHAARQGRPCVRCSASHPPSEAMRKRWRISYTSAAAMVKSLRTSFDRAQRGRAIVRALFGFASAERSEA